MKEKEFEKKTVDEIKELLPGCRIIKGNSSLIQGISDRCVLYKSKYAYLEIKISESASKRPNQDYYLEEARSDGAFGAFIYPENKENVLKELVNYFNN